MQFVGNRFLYITCTEDTTHNVVFEAHRCCIVVVLHCALSFHILGGRGARGGELVGMSRVSARLLSHISLSGQQSLPGCVRVKVSCSKVIVLQACACYSARAVYVVSRRERVVCVLKMVTGGGTVSPAGVPGPGLIANNAAGCVTTATPTPVPDTAGLPPQRRTSENRRVSLRFQQVLDIHPSTACHILCR